MVSVLPNDNVIPTQGFDPSEVLAGIRALRPAEPQSAWVTRETRSEREAQSLAGWADERGLSSARVVAPHADELTGGEHFVTLKKSSDLVP